MSSGSLYDKLKYFITYLKDIRRKQIGFKVIMFINSILFNSLLNVYLLLLVFTHIHVWMLMCTNACADACMCIYACGGWRSTLDVVSQCCLPYVSRQGFPLAWNSPVGLSCLHLFSTSLNVHNTMLGLYGFEGSNLVLMFAREPLTN